MAGHQHPGVETPDYGQIVPLGRSISDARIFKGRQTILLLRSGASADRRKLSDQMAALCRDAATDGRRYSPARFFEIVWVAWP
jgi:hypothetical protein